MADGIKKYHVNILPQTQKKLSKLDKTVRDRISNWIDKTLEGCENPRQFGIALQGNLAGKWRYRVGKYRLIAEIRDDEILILIVDVDKRNDIYKN
ncbi:MAG: type II toxin-antitoxin system RelE/ParE family toxin [Selenomonadaceae bacterium]|nr:type II toxin-antitoxin system RelE/ParE family toxin [Selenomonadaceae bacterium]